MTTDFSFDDASISGLYPSQMGFNALAKDLNIGRNSLYQFLREQGVLDQYNMPTEDYNNKDYFINKTKYIPGASYDFLMVTNEGIKFINELVKAKYVKKKYKKKFRDYTGFKRSGESI